MCLGAAAERGSTARRSTTSRPRPDSGRASWRLRLWQEGAVPNLLEALGEAEMEAVRQRLPPEFAALMA